jgi:hypothetical protein
MSATAGKPGGLDLLIARLIADPATLETRLDAASAALAETSLQLAGAELLAAETEYKFYGVGLW